MFSFPAFAIEKMHNGFGIVIHDGLWLPLTMSSVASTAFIRAISRSARAWDIFLSATRREYTCSR